MSMALQSPKSHLVPAVATLAAALLALLLAAGGSGAFGLTPVASAAGGYLSSTATPLAPANAAFGIWSVIYLGLLAYAVWQLGRRARADALQQRLRPWAAASMLLNAAWLWAAQLGSLPATLVVMVLLLAVLCRILVLTEGVTPRAGVEWGLSAAVFGLYLGWICVATVANVAAVLAWSGVAWPELPTAVVVFVAVVAIGLALARRGAWTPLVSMVWGVAWIAVARWQGPRYSAGVALVALLAAVVLVFGAALLLARRRTGRA
ncbi:tryptophan-rich sensory protein [Arthrobacter woluwensis]|uniref:tryptophan-rich sensory protein n=1 Tax=Arthrobacter woluwensis TaxID=156980 RepID=UPI001AAE9544|nr:tryptophan-rich sensory protein [Arthrobacter woluwensis]QTF71501.1 tryptophan-rich sensory protein [Arthrobacter woluwensis]